MEVPCRLYLTGSRQSGRLEKVERLQVQVAEDRQQGTKVQVPYNAGFILDPTFRKCCICLLAFNQILASLMISN